MSGKILILGAAGQLGFAAATAFRDAGWTVLSLVRPGHGRFAAEGTTVVEDDGLHAEAVLESAPGVDVVLHALNPAFRNWEHQALPMLDVAIAVAEEAGATLIYPGNLFNYGRRMPALIDENTPMKPTTRKGRLRTEAEYRLAVMSERGLKVIILRAGDFFGGRPGSWVDLVIARDIEANVVRYPGPLDVVHSWAYLPDYAAALVRLTEKRTSLGPFEPFGFPGHALTGQQFINAIRSDLGRMLRFRTFPWWPLIVLSPFLADWRELAEMRYLWSVPHRLSGERLAATIGDIPQTPLAEAIRATLDGANY